MVALRIQNATKRYANNFLALDDISFDVKEGEFFGLLGPNGAGKTSLIASIAGLQTLTSGNIEIMNKKAGTLDARHKLGTVLQECISDPFLTVYETLHYQSGYYGIKNNKAWIEELLTSLSLQDKADTNTRDLSGGMRRRLMIAQALVHKPPVVILDEPTAGVDIDLRYSMWDLMKNLNKNGHTMILTTHYLEEAQEHCERIALLKKGKLITLSSMDELLHSEFISIQITTKTPIAEDLQDRVSVTPRLCTYDASFANCNDMIDFLNKVKLSGANIERINMEKTRLEQVFLHLTGLK